VEFHAGTPTEAFLKISLRGFDKAGMNIYTSVMNFYASPFLWAASDHHVSP
jgi:hypothetical protein